MAKPDTMTLKEFGDRVLGPELEKFAMTTTPPPSMIEKMARAVYERGQWGSMALQTLGGDVYREKRDWAGKANIDREECLQLARAAIEAMREPTEAMIDDLRLYPEGWRYGDEWRRLISAALEGK